MHKYDVMILDSHSGLHFISSHVAENKPVTSAALASTKIKSRPPSQQQFKCGMCSQQQAVLSR